MPRVWEEKGYKFYLYLNESRFEPAHVHVLGNDGEMKVWLNDDLDNIWKSERFSISTDWHTCLHTTLLLLFTMFMFLFL